MFQLVQEALQSGKAHLIIALISVDVNRITNEFIKIDD
jgi:hypothetical protein